MVDKILGEFMALLLEQVAQNNTALVFVSHDMNLAKSFSRIEAIASINQASVNH